MSKAWLLVKDNKLTHHYSDRIKDEKVKEGWFCVGSVTGWNLAFYYSNEEMTIPQERGYLKNRLRQLDKKELEENAR